MIWLRTGVGPALMQPRHRNDNQSEYDCPDCHGESPTRLCLAVHPGPMLVIQRVIRPAHVSNLNVRIVHGLSPLRLTGAPKQCPRSSHDLSLAADVHLLCTGWREAD